MALCIQILERLNNEIEHERARIRTLEDDEQNMLKHHARAASYVRKQLARSNSDWHSQPLNVFFRIIL
jgi:hypothetical protein